MRYQVLDLFSGIGGFSLGLERTGGFQTVAMCESDGYARRVLRKHWPEVWLYEDIRTLTAQKLRKDGLSEINVIVGGFPCQDISAAGKGAGLEGERSGLWSEMLRLIKEIKPLWVIVENVPTLRVRGADRVLDDLERVHYTATPVVVGARHIGAPHKRDRVWIVAHSQSEGQRLRAMGHRGEDESVQVQADVVVGGEIPHANGDGCRRSNSETEQADFQNAARCSWWEAECGVCRVSDDVSVGVDGTMNRINRLRCLGNAVVPLLPEIIGRAILEATGVL